MSQNNHSNGFMIGMLAGGLIGAFLGVAYAPKEGVETRKKLKEEADKFSKKAKPAIETAQKSVGPIILELEKAVAPLIEEAKKEIKKATTKEIQKVKDEVMTLALDDDDAAQEPVKINSKKKFKKVKSSSVNASKSSKKRLFKGVKR